MTKRKFPLTGTCKSKVTKLLNALFEERASYGSDDEDGGPDGERLRRDVERIETSLQAQIKELKGFVTGMNSMLGAALSAAQLYRDEGGDAKLAAGVGATPRQTQIPLQPTTMRHLRVQLC